MVAIGTHTDRDRGNKFTEVRLDRVRRWMSFYYRRLPIVFVRRQPSKRQLAKISAQCVETKAMARNEPGGRRMVAVRSCRQENIPVGGPSGIANLSCRVRQEHNS